MVSSAYPLGDWTVDPTTRRLTRGQDERRLSPKAMAVLTALHEAGGDVLSRQQLLQSVWPNVIVCEEVLTHAIAEIRKALGDSRQQPRYVETVQKSGYRLIAPAMASAGQPDRTSGLIAEGTPAARSRPSIAVLPFANKSGDSCQDYFADGFTEDLITDLSRFHSLTVIARHSSFSFRDHGATVREIGSELDVGYVVEGSVRRNGATVRICAQLVEAASGQQIWGERYDLGLEEIFAVQDELVGRIASKLRERIHGFGLEKLHNRGTDNLTAYEHVLRGRFHYDRMTATGVRTAKRDFERAVEIDPGYAIALAHLARIHIDEALFSWVENTSTARTRALELAEQAVVLDGSDGFVQATLGIAHLYLKRYRQAEKCLDQAVALNPAEADTLIQRAVLAELLGRPDECLDWICRAFRLDPYPPDWQLWALVRGCFLGRQYAEAIATATDMERAPFEVHGIVAACHALMGNGSAAWTSLSRFLAEAEHEMVAFPGDDPMGWQSYWSGSFPYRHRSDLEHLFNGLRRAGLPLPRGTRSISHATPARRHSRTGPVPAPRDPPRAGSGTI